MEIKIRKLSPHVLAKIDEMARSSGKSRNRFLVEQIEMIAKDPDLKLCESKFENLVREMAAVIKNNTDIVKQLFDNDYEEE